MKELLQTVSSRASPTTYCRPDYTATLCSDLRIPRAGGAVSTLETAVRRLDPKQLYPYDVRTARQQLIVDGCLRWPAARMSTYSAAAELLPRTLILHGNDLFCPVEWARWEQTHARSAQLVVVPGSGHGVQRVPRGREAARAFLLG